MSWDAITTPVASQRLRHTRTTSVAYISPATVLPLPYYMLYKITNSIVAIDPIPYLKPIRTTTRTNLLSFLHYRYNTESLNIHIFAEQYHSGTLYQTQTIYNQIHRYQKFQQNYKHTPTPRVTSLPIASYTSATQRRKRYRQVRAHR